MKSVLCLLAILFIYKAIFINSEIIGGDWPYYYQEYLKAFNLPTIWSPVWPSGLGGNQAIILPLKLYLHLVVMIFVNTLGIPWEVVQKIFFFWLFLVLSIYSSYKFTKSWIGVLIYTTNTWILMVLSGGQIGIALAYAIAPLVILHFTRIVSNTKVIIASTILAALIFSVQILLDVRLSFITILIVLGYTLFHFFFIQKINLKLLVLNTLIVSVVATLIHAFWVLPSVFIYLKGGNVANIVDTSTASLEFFSFAKFENSLSLLHPNWPENIFGKVSFMKPEFLIIPILAFGSLLFVKNMKAESRYSVLFFALVGLIGAFLAKGTQEPFGIIFIWLYTTLPGFNLFRDPVKFYIPIIISYSILIPYFLNNISKKNISKSLTVLFILFWFTLISPISSNPIGIFKKRTVQDEYVKLSIFVSSQNEFFRTLWYPKYQRFGYVSDNHPAISYQELFKSNKLNKETLSNMAVKYIIIPYDSEDEIFLSDRKYNEKEYLKTVQSVKNLPWVKSVGEYGKIKVFEISNPKPHMFTKGDKLIFSEAYDKLWYVETEGQKVYSKPFGLLNSFKIPNSQEKDFKIVYEPEKWARIGYIISGGTIVLAIIFIGISLRRKRKPVQVS